MSPGNTRPWKPFLLTLWGACLLAAVSSPQLLPEADPADLVTRQTARVAVLYWGLAAGLLLWPVPTLARWTWTLAWTAYVIHVVVAFDRFHGWSHAAAIEHVEGASGFGPGIYVSHAFGVLWTLDVLWWWLFPTRYRNRPAWLDRLVHAFFAFIVFNGTVVYEDGLIRWVGLGIFLGLAVLFIRRLRFGWKVSGFHFLA